MNSKFYISLEAARLLKEKGYDEVISTFYNEDGLLLEVVAYYNLVFLAIDELNDDHYPALTKDEVIDWLESKGMCIVVVRRTIDNKVGWCYAIYSQTGIISGFSTRLEAEDAAIIKACELLINEN